MISFEKSVGAIIFRKTREGVKYLLLNYGNDYWGLVKGHMDEGESEIETLKRETKEETGIEDLIIAENFRENFHYFYRAKGKEKEERLKKGLKTFIYKKVIFYLAETKSEAIKLSHEHIGFEWLNFDETITKISFKDPKKLLEKAKKFIEKDYSVE